MLVKILILFTMLISASTARAQDPLQTCNERVTACEQVVEKAIIYIGTLRTQVNIQEALIAQLELDRKLAAEQLAAVTPKWYERPGFVIPATVIGTAASIFLLRRAAQ